MRAYNHILSNYQHLQDRPVSDNLLQSVTQTAMFRCKIMFHCMFPCVTVPETLKPICWRFNSYNIFLKSHSASRRIDSCIMLQKTINLLKMDIEGSEWEVLQSFLSSPEAFDLVTKRVRQIALEIHTGPFQLSNARQQLEKLNGFEQKLGFRRWSFNVNPYCEYVHLGKPRSQCYELVYINKEFISLQDLKS